MPLMIETSTAASEQGAPLLRGSTPPDELIPRFRDGLIEGSKGGGVLPPPRPPIVVIYKLVQCRICSPKSLSSPSLR